MKRQTDEKKEKLNQAKTKTMGVAALNALTRPIVEIAGLSRYLILNLYTQTPLGKVADEFFSNLEESLTVSYPKEITSSETQDMEQYFGIMWDLALAGGTLGISGFSWAKRGSNSLLSEIGSALEGAAGPTSINPLGRSGVCVLGSACFLINNIRRISDPASERYMTVEKAFTSLALDPDQWVRPDSYLEAKNILNRMLGPEGFKLGDPMSIHKVKQEGLYQLITPQHTGASHAFVGILDKSSQQMKLIEPTYPSLGWHDPRHTSASQLLRTR